MGLSQILNKQFKILTRIKKNSEDTTMFKF